MQKEAPLKGISGNLGSCLVYYLMILLLCRLYPTHLLHMLLSGILFWILLPYAERFLHRMIRPIRRALPKKKERSVIGSSLVRMKPRLD